MNKILILVGTMSGTAEMAADEIADRLDDMDIEARVLRMERATVATITAATHIIICTSTYGTGDVPDNAKELFSALQNERPGLSGLSYGVFALGSSVYPKTFCFGGKRFDDLLSELGAKRIGEHFQHSDRSGINADDAAGEWVENWAQLVLA
ncbi:flavodoxin domain-containing protein [Pusillimonas sp.]|uniref:flavodoxin domain-containing protein n=1 Tax=Pusillimonas sp. TaxID=3040095 RepID=UPI0029B52ADA|nr:flavodoxin domain-containing protein [Pusillimonas sp.]MDX3895450.1 flavodoxin domain-containing protein [Pusillimonas sp.]